MKVVVLSDENLAFKFNYYQKNMRQTKTKIYMIRITQQILVDDICVVTCFSIAKHSHAHVHTFCFHVNVKIIGQDHGELLHFCTPIFP